MAKSILITGCSRGIGRQLVQQALKHKNIFDRIYATARVLNEDLHSLVEEHREVRLIQLDVTSETDIRNAVTFVKGDIGERGLNYLINNAGISTKSAKLEWLSMEKMNQHLAVNVSAPVIMVKEFLPLLKQADSASVINVSSSMGSITSCENGLHIPYRSSKAALNMATKALSLYLNEDKINSVSIHPGWVRTQLGGSRAPMSVEESSEKIFNTVILKWDEAYNGKFIDEYGAVLSP